VLQFAGGKELEAVSDSQDGSLGPSKRHRKQPFQSFSDGPGNFFRSGTDEPLDCEAFRQYS
jgi:hypothetical protein